MRSEGCAGGFPFKASRAGAKKTKRRSFDSPRFAQDDRGTGLFRPAVIYAPATERTA
jgi:hypothetical protein